MQISVKRTVYDDVVLSESNVNEVTRNRLRQILLPGEYIRKEGDKFIVKQDDPHWRHGSVSEYYVRDATELDLAAWKVLQNLD